MSPASLRGRAWPAHHHIAGFEVLRTVRESDTGILYRGWDHALLRTVLLEEFLPAALAQRGPDGLMVPAMPASASMLARARQLFVDEARLLARADHPALARVLHLIEAHGTAVRVLPGYAGTTLSELMARGDAPRDEPALRRLLDDTLGALDAWHAVGGQHGNVQPSRIVWLDNGHALLLGPDSASLTPLGASAWSGAAAGEDVLLSGNTSPAHPEGRGDDLQSLALVVRACMFGTAPVERGLPLQLALEGAGRTNGAAPQRYSAALVQALDAALSSDSTRRPAHCAQFRQWLQRGIETPAPPAPPASPASPTAPGGATPTKSALRPVPAPPAPAALAPAGEEERDAVTSALIRSVVDAIPDGPPRSKRRPHPAESASGSTPQALRTPGLAPLSTAPPTPAQQPNGESVFLEPAFDDEPLRAPQRAPRVGQPGDPSGPSRPAPRARRSLLWAGMAVGMLAIAALTLQQQWPLRVPSAQEPSLGTPSGTPPVTVSPPAEPVVVEPAPSLSTPAPDADVPVELPASASGSDPAPAPQQTQPSVTAPVPTSPRQQCGARTEFSLYRCMQQQCSQARWRAHPQCVQLHQTDRVPD